MFLEKVYQGKGDIGRWFAMIVILIIVTQFVGSIPLGIMIFLQMSDNPDLEPDPENLFDLSAYDISQITGLALTLIPFVLGFFILLLLMKPIHERTMLSVITGHPSFRWRKFFWGTGVWFLLLSFYSIFAALTGIQTIELRFDPATFFTLIAVSVLLLPFQAGFEELFFRGYLMQGFAKVFKYKWIPLIFTSVIFGVIHFSNPEVKDFGTMVMMPQYIWFGIFFGICTLMDEGLELAWGVHTINNIFLSVLFTHDSSTLQTPALYRITDFNPAFDLIALVTLSLIFILAAHRKFHWPEWKYLTMKMGMPDHPDNDLPDYNTDEYDEYDEYNEK
jgi:membrane protease YdiL (CAAX protease family)